MSYFMGCIVLVRCVLVLRCGLAGLVWYPDAGFSLHPDTTPVKSSFFMASLYQNFTFISMGRSGIEYRCGRDFSPVQTDPGAHPVSCKMGTGFFPGVKCDRGVLLTTHPLLVPRSWKSRAIPLPTLWATPSL